VERLFFLIVGLSAINDWEAQLGDDLALRSHFTSHGFAGLDGSNATGGTGQDDIALLKLHDGGDMLDQRGDPMRRTGNKIQDRCELQDPPIDLEDQKDRERERRKESLLEDHVACVSILLGDSVNLERQVHVIRVWDLLLGDELSHGGEGVIALGGAPRQSSLLGGVLKVTGGHVQGQGVSCNVLVSVLGSDIPTVLSNDDTELHFVMDLTTLWNLDALSGADE